MISFSDTIIDKENQEILEHGTTEFPIACYFDDLRKKVIPWHFHEELEVGIVTLGSILIHTPNYQSKLSQGECFLINSGILHKIKNLDSEADCHVDSLVFHARLTGGNIDSIFWRKFIRPVITNPEITLLHFKEDSHQKQIDIIQSAWMECATGDYGYEVNVRYLLSTLFLSINQAQPEVLTTNSKKMALSNERVKKMLTYIREGFHENITVQQIADSAAISESECLRCFRKVLGISPIAYLKIYRLQNAAELINSTEWKISYIGEQCGFSEMSYFAKSFREVYHCSPSEYRLSNCKTK